MGKMCVHMSTHVHTPTSLLPPTFTKRTWPMTLLLLWKRKIQADLFILLQS